MSIELVSYGAAGPIRSPSCDRSWTLLSHYAPGFTAISESIALNNPGIYGPPILQNILLFSATLERC